MSTERRLTRRRFLEIIGVAAVGMAAGCSDGGPKPTETSVYPSLTPTGIGNEIPNRTLVPPSLTATSLAPSETATDKAIETSTPEETLEALNGGKFEKLGKGKVVPDSVWPGGIDKDKGVFSKDEALAVVEIYNGATARTDNQGNGLKLSAARVYAESIFGLKGKIDANTLVELKGGDKEIKIGARELSRTSDVYWQATGTGLIFRMFECVTPPGMSYNQIAASDKTPGRAYVNNGSVLNGEVMYVVYVLDEESNAVNTLTFRGACGNIGSVIKRLPQPTPGSTPQQLATPTQFGGTPEQTVVPTKLPSVTPARTQPPQATRTPGGTGATPIVPTPVPTAKPTEIVNPTVPVASSSTPSF